MALKIKLAYRRLVIAPLMTFRSLDTDTLSIVGQPSGANRKRKQKHNNNNQGQDATFREFRL